MPKELAGNFTFVIDSFRMTKYGGVKMTLCISEEQAAQALALAMYPEAVYDADVFLVKQS